MTYKTIAILIIACFTSSLVHSQNLLDKVIAKVGSEFITLSDIEEEFQYGKSQEPQLTEDAKCGILEGAIAQKVLIYQAKLDSVEVGEDEVETQLNLRFESILRSMNGDEGMFKEVYGVTINDMKERYRDEQKQKLLAERMQYKLMDEVAVTPEEVLEFFNNIPTDSLPLLNSEVELSELIIEPVINQNEREKALLEAEEVQMLLTGGADFAELAKKHSDDTESAKRGGDLGFAKRGSYVPEFEGAVFGLAPGEFSEIIETEFGYHIIQTIERRGNSVKARHILVKPVITKADELLAKEKLDSIRSLILIDSLSFAKAVKKFGSKDVQSYYNNGKMKNQSTGNNFYETKDLDPDTYFAVDNLKVNDITKVLEEKDYRGQKKFRIVQLNSLSKPHRVNLKQDYDKISLYAKESKKSNYFAEWLDKKMGETFIKIDPIFNECPNLSTWMQ